MKLTKLSDIDLDTFIMKINKELNKLDRQTEAIKILAVVLDKNTLFRSLPFNQAKVVSNYLDIVYKDNPELEQTLKEVLEEINETH